MKRVRTSQWGLTDRLWLSFYLNFLNSDVRKQINDKLKYGLFNVETKLLTVTEELNDERLVSNHLAP